MTYYVIDSQYGEDAWIYDEFTIQIELADDCSDFRWSDTTDTNPYPTGFTYTVKFDPNAIST